MKRSEIFSELGDRSVVYSVVMQIEQLIVEGILSEGMKLPSERELASILCVSREKLREALRQLEAANLLIARQGDGTYVGKLTGNAFSPAMLELYSRHPKGLEDYLEYRKEIEGFAARLAAERATDVDKWTIADCLKRQTEALDAGNLAGSLTEDIQFHTAIVEAAHSSMITHTTKSMYGLMERGIMYNRKVLRKTDESSNILIQQHHAIADAIFAGNVEGAVKASHLHLDYVGNALREEALTVERREVSIKRQAVRSSELASRLNSDRA